MKENMKKNWKVFFLGGGEIVLTAERDESNLAEIR